MSAAGPQPRRAAIEAERDDRPEPMLDRLHARLRFGLRWLLRSEVRDPRRMLASIDAKRAALRGTPAVEGLNELAYRLRRDGFTLPLVTEALALYCEARSVAGLGMPSADVLAAAGVLAESCIVQIARREEQMEVLAAAAALHAMSGSPVHVLTSSEPYAVAMAARLSNDLRPLGLTVSAVTAGQGLRDRIETYRSDIVCGTLRDVAQDYLRDRIRLTRSRSKLGSLAERLGGESAGEAGVLRGLHSALIADADVVMLDDALVPVAIAADADTSHERLLYEQALALAQTLQAPLDFTVNDGAVVLSALGASLLERRAHGLGGLWSATRRRETIVASALHVLHGWTDGRDYRVREGRLEWPSSEQKLEGDAAEEQALRRKLAEIKEGCDLTAKRDVVARLPVTRFLRRYRHLGGACADVRGISGELQSLYPVRVRALWSAAASAACVYRVCLDVETKVRVLLDVVRKGQGEGRAIVIAARSSEVADALLANLKAAGLEVELLHAGLEAAAVEGTLCILDRACGIVLALHPAARLFRRERATAIPVDLVIVELHEGPHAAAHLVHAFGADTCTALLSFDDKALDLGAIIEQSARLLAGSKKTLNPTASRAIAMLAQRRLDAERAIQRQEGLSREQYLADLLAFSGRRE